MSQNQCFIELETLEDLARYVCASREYPLRVYSIHYKNKEILSSTLTLANTLVIFYIPTIKSGSYISYSISSGKEICNIVNSTKNISTYAPIIHFENTLTQLPTKNISDKFHPIKLKDLGSLARLTYDPESIDEPKLTLYTFSHKDKWNIGYITSLEMDSTYYQFNYVELNSKPNNHFLKYHGDQVKEPEFSDSFVHGFSYMPIIFLKENHPIFGFT